MKENNKETRQRKCNNAVVKMGVGRSIKGKELSVGDRKENSLEN